MTVTSRTDGVVGHPDRHDAERGGAPTWWRDDASPARADDPSPAPGDPAASVVFDYDALSPELRAADVFGARSRRSRRAVVSSSLVRSDGGLPAVPAPASPPGGSDPAAMTAVVPPPPAPRPAPAEMTVMTAVVPSPAAPRPAPAEMTAMTAVVTAPTAAAPAGRRVGSSHLPLHLRQRRARLSVFVVLAVTAGLTVLALLTARSPAVPTPSSVSTAPAVSVTTGRRVGVGTAGLAPTIEPPPASLPGTAGLSGAANAAPAP
jgi:hypothetical protein